MPNHISLSDFVLNRVCCLVPFRILLRGLFSNLWLCVPRGFDPQCSPVQPDPTQPGPAQLSPRVPGARALPMRAPPSPGLFLSFDFSRAATSLPPLSLPVVP
jgi:hypothetical protein